MGSNLVSVGLCIIILTNLYLNNQIIGKYFNGPTLNGTAKHSILSHPDTEHETTLVAALNGTIYSMDPKSRKILWSFATGQPIYSSYHVPLNHDIYKENSSGPGCSYFIDFGNDWNLYIHSELGKVKLEMSIEEYIRTTPHITKDGQVVLGSQDSTVFAVDPKTGRLILSSTTDSPPPSSQSNEEKNAFYSTTTEETGHMNLKADKLLLYILRRDYTLIQFDRYGSVLWKVTVADIRANFLKYMEEVAYD